MVGASGVVLGEGSVTIGGTVLAPGDTITIDGATGDVFAGAAAGVTQVVPEAAVLLAWARDLGIEIEVAEHNGRVVPVCRAGASAGGGSCHERPAGRGGTGCREHPDHTGDVIRVLVVKGYAGPDANTATALRCSEEDAAATLDRLVADGLVETAAGSFRLTADGKSIGHERITEDTARWGVDNALAALDAFLVLDHRMKDTVTAWQMREVDGTRPTTTTVTRSTTRRSWRASRRFTLTRRRGSRHSSPGCRGWGRIVSALSC